MGIKTQEIELLRDELDRLRRRRRLGLRHVPRAEEELPVEVGLLDRVGVGDDAPAARLAALALGAPFVALGKNDESCRSRCAASHQP